MHISKAGLGRLQAFPLLFQAGWGTATAGEGDHQKKGRHWAVAGFHQLLHRLPYPSRCHEGGQMKMRSSPCVVSPQLRYRPDLCQDTAEQLNTPGEREKIVLDDGR
jgi:hypothetical protein